MSRLRDILSARSILWAAFAFLAVDRLAKAAALNGVTATPFPWAEFRLFRNTGIAFSLPLADAIFWPNAVLILGVLVWVWWRMRAQDALGAACVAWIILGSLSNIADRAAYGAVIDYLIFFGRSAMNIADGMIVGGVAAILLRKK